MSDTGDEIYFLAVMAAMALAGLAALLLRDYVVKQHSKNLPVLPLGGPALLLRLAALSLFVGIGFCLWRGYLLFAIILTFVTAVACSAHTRRAGLAHRYEATLLDELAYTVERRLPLTDYFKAFAKEHFGDDIYLGKTVMARLSSGMPLSAALENTGILPLSALAPIRAAEEAGGAPLAAVLRRLSCEAKERARLFAGNALWIDYPFTVLSFWLALVGVPILMASKHISVLFRYMGVAAWWPVYLGYTKIGLFLTLGILIGLGEFIRLVYAPRQVRFVAFRQHFREKIWRATRLMPFLRKRFRHRSLARAARTLGAMLEAGVPLHTAGALVAVPEIAGPHRGSFEKLAARARDGAPWPVALRESGLPESFVTLAQAGAAAGDLPLALSSAAEWHESKARRIERWLSALLPCLAIVCCGVLVASIYIGVLYGINQLQTSLIPNGLAR